ncbi:hypothetical protein R1flu_009599 [Riccia fluitans]|uniref:Uncharacterized protein n=1 Tax=Riccia fluitans TaxID=41844 RepID=A0ABD1Z2J9_9MARC
MRISGAPRVIRKQASSTNKVFNSANLHHLFSTSIRGTGALQPLQNNRTLGPQCSATADDLLNSKVGSVTTSKNLIPGVEELDKEVITIEDDDDPKSSSGYKVSSEQKAWTRYTRGDFWAKESPTWCRTDEVRVQTTRISWCANFESHTAGFFYQCSPK